MSDERKRIAEIEARLENSTRENREKIFAIWFIGLIISAFTAPTLAHALVWPLWILKVVL